MLSSIHLNYHPLFQTNKVNDISSQRLLPAKFVALELPEAKLSPKQTFGVRRVISKLSGAASYLVHPPILAFPHKGGRNSNAKQPVKFYKAGIDRENAPLIRTCLASQPPNVSFSFTLSTAPSASARCSPGRAPPLGWWGISTSGRLTMPKNFASVLPSSINID